MIAILDSMVFFSDFPVSFPAYTTYSVVSELVDIRSKCRYEALVASGLLVKDPGDVYCGQVRAGAGHTGDISVLSGTDIDILSLALELNGTIITDDFAVQNVAANLGIPTMPVHQRSARARVWKFRCSGCGRYFKKTGDCPVCGSAIKRKLK